MLLVQQYLLSHSFEDLAKNFGVYASFSKSGHKFSLNYDQIEAKEADPLAQECRGLILSAEDGHVFTPVEFEGRMKYDHHIPGKTKILAFPMKRFFNYGQGSAANINWSDPNLAVLEKLDGTLCIVYFDPWTNKWCVATRSVPEADLIMDNGLFTFRTLFEKALKDTCGKDFKSYTESLNKQITYCFELTTPYNRIVVNYTENRVTLLAARALYGNLEEFDLQALDGNLKWVKYNDLDQKIKNHLSDLGKTSDNTPEACIQAPYDLLGVPVALAHKYTSVSELLDWVSSLNPMEHEGVVVRDSDFNRIKVKNAAYVAYNKVRDALGTSERNCMELILAEKDDDVISMLPEEIVNNLKKLKENLKVAIHLYDSTYDMIKNQSDIECPNDKKTFALNVAKFSKEKNLWTAPFFQRFGGKHSNMRDFINSNRKEGSWSDSFLDKILSITKSIDI